MNIAAAPARDHAGFSPLDHADAAIESVDAAVADARAALRARVAISNAAREAEQYAAHSLAWAATYAEALREMTAWARGLERAGKFGEMERLILGIGLGEYLAQLRGGLPMSQGEIARLSDLGGRIGGDAVEALIEAGNTDAARMGLVALMIARRPMAIAGSRTSSR